MGRTVTFDVDVEDVLGELLDDEVLREYEARGLSKRDEPDAKDVAARAIAAIKTGRVVDGITMLEREFFPVWADKDAAERAYQLAMSLKVAA